MNTTNIIRTTSILLTLGLCLGACQGLEDIGPGAGLGDEDEASSGDPGDDDRGDDDDDGSDDDGSDDGDALSCGNTVVEAGEDCDDNDSNELDGCLSDCRFGPLDIKVDDSAPTVLEQRGNLGGGDAHDDACPEGEVITGIRGRSGLLFSQISQLQLECGVLALAHPDAPEALDLAIAPGTVLPERGGFALSTFEARCPDDHAVVGFGGNSGSAMDQIILSCARMRIDDDGMALSVGFDESFDLEPVGGSGGGEFVHAYCEPGEVATIGNTRSGLFLDAFGLTCMPVELVF